MSLVRVTDWQARFAGYLTAAQTRVFQWGSFDCALAVCDGINAITGTDLGAPYRGTYSSEGQALTIIGGSLGAFAAQIALANGCPQVAAAMARRGDVVLINNATPTNALGQVDLSGRYAWCVAATGMVRVPMRYWLQAWRIG